MVDPIQSVKGKVVIDAFRLTNPHLQALGQEIRQTTSNLGHLQKPSIQVCNNQLIPIIYFRYYIICTQALIHGLGRHYYSLPINYRKNELEQKVNDNTEMIMMSFYVTDVVKLAQEDMDGWSLSIGLYTTL